MHDWTDWIGRERRQSDRCDFGTAQRWCATFDLPPPADTLPQGIHFSLCTPQTPTAALDQDGHPARGDEGEGFLPPLPLPRRMWAASALQFHHPIAVGQAVERISHIAAITPKEGRGGPLLFVEIDHATIADGRLAIEERQTLVYRDAAPGDAPFSPPLPQAGSFDGTTWDAHRTIVPDARLLFRFSALTFNAHRIHYDVEYARAVERYRGLVVHGPLIASLLLQLAATRLGDNRLTRFAFRAISPAIAGDPLHFALREVGNGMEFGAFADDGRQLVDAEGSLA